jgi:hypothetical protein
MDFLREFAKMAQEAQKEDDDIPDLVGDANFEDVAET